MFKGLRHLRISLAVKCQLLFGAAVVAIIAAALYVPWQRMQQLTGLLNERAASAVATNVLAEHMERQTERLKHGSVDSAMIDMQEQPVMIDGQAFAAPRLIGLPTLKKTDSPILKFDRGSYARFVQDSDKPSHAQDFLLKNGAWGYRYSRPLSLTQDCARCHVVSLAQASALLPLFPNLEPLGGSPNKRAAMLGIVRVEIPSQIESSQLLLNHIFILTAGLVAGTLAIVIFYLITTRLILQPVRVLQETAEKVSKGDLNIRSDISTGDEFQQLSETFNTMLVNLKSSADQLRAVNKSLDLKLGQLAESNVALYESNRLKSEFLANVSHELRTPLNSILGFAELLKDAGAASPADVKSARYLQNILHSANNLLALINDLLDLAKIEAGRMEVRSEPLSLNDIFEALSNLLKPLTEAKALQVTCAISPDVPIIHTDPAKLQQVLYNFLSNAIKFSPRGETIELSAEMISPAAVRIVVSDHGPGIDPAKHGVIFEKFRQIDGSVTRQHSGSGLGLAISKELITLLSGSIGVKSSPDEGATFWVVLPLKIESGAQDVRGRLVLT